MPEKPRRSISRAMSRVWRRRPGTATRLIAGRGSGIGGSVTRWAWQGNSKAPGPPQIPCRSGKLREKIFFALRTIEAFPNNPFYIKYIRCCNQHPDRFFEGGGREAAGKASNSIPAHGIFILTIANIGFI